MRAITFFEHDLKLNNVVAGLLGDSSSLQNIERQSTQVEN